MPDRQAIKAAPLPAWQLWLAIVAVSILWGVNWPVMRLALAQVPPWTFRFVTALGAGIILLAICKLTGQPMRFPRALLRPFLVVTFLGVTCWHMFSAFGVMAMGGGRAAIIAFTMPVWTTLIAIPVLRERPTLKTWAALALALAGLVVLILPDLERIERSPLGTLLMLGAAISWGGSNVAIKAYDWPLSTMALAGWQLVIGVIPIGIVWAFLELPPDLSRLGWTGIWTTAYACVVALVFCFSCFLLVLRHLPAVAASLSMMAIPVVGLGSAAWMLGEPAGMAEIGALTLVLAAMSLVLIKPRRAG